MQTEPAIAGSPAPAPLAHVGLSSAEAERLLKAHGPNVLSIKQKRKGLLRTIAAALLDPMALMLLIASIIYFFLGDRFDAAVALGALIPVVGVEIVLEGRAERALEKLAELAALQARACRDGSWVRLDAARLVPGDLIELREGDVVPADSEILEGTQLLLDESLLTGEAHPVDKRFGCGERALAGTVVLAGRATALVATTGVHTEYGRIGALVAGVAPSHSPLQRSIQKLFARLAVVAGLACVAVVALLLLSGQGLGQSLVAGVSLGVAAMPEEFPMVFTLFLTLGAWRLSKQNALARKLTAVETLGGTTVICTDKTGTLTLGRMAVAEAIPVGGCDARRLREAAVLASEPTPFDPMERALLADAASHGVDVESLHAGALVGDYPFDPKRKLVTHVWRHERAHRVFVKGAVEGVLAAAQIDATERARLLSENARLAESGMRVIAVAEGALAGPPSGERLRDESALRVLGLVALEDPVRPGVMEALAACRSAGVRVVMITGDHPLTAHAVANGLQLPHDDADPVITGDAVDALDDTSLAARAKQVSIFSRMRPEQKFRLVKAFQRDGEIVAMTGDGVNDAPALRQADIGVAMGERGTEVAREAASLVLLDDNFATIVQAVRGGRRIADNLRKSFAYLIAYHVPIILLALLAPLLGMPLLLLPVELVFLELVLHPTVALVFEGEPAERDLMTRPPRRPTAALIDARSTLRPVLLGLTLTVVSLAIYARELAMSGELIARAMAFVALVVGEALLVLTERSPGLPFWRASYRGQRTLAPVLAANALALALVLYVPPVAEAFHLESLSRMQLGAAVLAGAAATLWGEPWKVIRARRTT
ncbi:MAG: cation-transporting P-type ATPase [Deltaproteobacteria bacterium]|nr:cation-transporting P-type ATPase [Deltaproteobacteria bacterium]